MELTTNEKMFIQAVANLRAAVMEVDIDLTKVKSCLTFATDMQRRCRHTEMRRSFQTAVDDLRGR